MPLPIPFPAVAATAAILMFVKKGDVADWLHVRIAKGRKTKPGQAFLKDNYAPVREEVFEEDLEVEGELPAELDGIYLRNGPNPFYEPLHGYHWFDGDGMLHACLIKDGKASYCNRYVETSKLKQEQKAGRPIFVKFGDQSGLRGLGVTLLHQLKRRWQYVDGSHGEGTGNTALTFHAGKLLALHEGDMPYAMKLLCNGVVETAGRLAVPGWKQFFTAHPKLDEATGELFFFGYSFEKAPFLTVGVLDAKGELVRQVPVDLPWPAMMHDMALSRSYMVLLHLPLTVDGEAMVKHNKLPIAFMKDKPARIGLMPRDATSAGQLQWFELPAFMCFHTAAALEDPETGKVRLFASTFNDFDLNLEEPDESMRQQISVVELDPKTGKATRRAVCGDLPGDFPVTHPSLVGGNPRWAYYAVIQRGSHVEFDGIAKVDMMAAEGTEDACVARLTFPEGCYGGEAVFVPRNGAAGAAEDDGFLMVYVYHSKEQVSKLHVYDASTMSSTPLATVALPQRVPYGFHGMWVGREQMKAQSA